jgi:hypothetical protein
MPFIKVPLGQSYILLRFSPLRHLFHQADPRYSHAIRKSFHTEHVVTHVVLGVDSYESILS